MQVFDITGRLVTTLCDHAQNAGEHKVEFRADNLASGVYLCRLQAEDQVQVRRMLLLR
jgi:hypothetical protein